MNPTSNLQLSHSSEVGTAVPAEIARFDALARRWWDPSGPMAPLHAMNPLRIGWIDKRIAAPARLLDIGCGAGLAAEALAKRGHDVLGIDAAPEPIAAAREHAAGQDLRLDYRVAAPEELDERFGVITALEVIEHVADPAAFLARCAGLLAPGGVLFVSTLNRTARSMLVAKLGAEYVLRLLPVGTHDWRRFVTPTELSAHARAAGLRVAETTGMSFSPLTGRWSASRDLGINYLAMLTN